MDRDLQQKNAEEQGRNMDRSLSTVLYFALAGELFFIVELYLIIAMPELVPAIIIAGAAVLVCSYLALATLVKRMKVRDEQQSEQYAGILKSEKASYLLIRKYFDEIEDQMSLLEDKMTEPFHEIIAAQKATAKVTINRNKENTDALMNSNDKLLELIFQLDGKLDGLSAALSANPAEHGGEEILQKQKELTNQLASQLSNQLKEMDLSLRNEILQTASKMSMAAPQVVMAAAPQPQMMPMASEPAAPALDPLPPMMEEPEPMAEPESVPELESMPEIEPEPIPEPEPVLESMPELEPMPESEPVPEPEPMPGMSDPNKMMSPNDIAALLTSVNPKSAAEPTPVEPVPVEEPAPVADEVVEDFAPQDTLAPLEAESVDEAPPMPDMSDPNKMMSPDDIAALLSSMNAESAAEPAPVEPVPAEEPVVVADEVVEDSAPQDTLAPLETEIVDEVPPMPDMSDPNKMMSPDDIAAILASVNAEAEALEDEPDIVADEVVEETPQDASQPMEAQIVEEKPPMPDLSDPNKVMSADEIAALFANLG